MAPIVGTATAAMAVVGTVLTLSASADAFRRVGAYGEPGPVVAGATTLLGVSLTLTAFVGALIAVRLPRHPLGWLLLTMAALWSIGSLTQGYTLVAHETDDVLPAGQVAAWANNHVWGPTLAILATVLLLFPSGRPISWAWGRAFAIVLAVSTAIMTVGAFAPGPMPLTLGVQNPLGLDALAPIPREALNTGVLLVVFLTVFAATSLIVRYRRATAVEQLQLRWVAAATSFVAAVFGLLAVLRPWDAVSDLVFWTSVATLPIAIGVAILRYRLYAIDLIIRRTLVYGTLTAVLGAGYVAAILLLQALLDPVTGGETLAVAAATLVAAAAFQPLRRGLQGLIDRRFYRARYDGARMTAQLATRIGREVDLEVIEADLVDAVVETVQPERVALWQRPVSGQRRHEPG
ncbi:MAG TPA: hypothetical protein VFR14_09765 [Candidatus Limnocylindrales bacterium]|nr:hypothetical protein [Candidatus Limnocylindrales bacterium]